MLVLFEFAIHVTPGVTYEFLEKLAIFAAKNRVKYGVDGADILL